MTDKTRKIDYETLGLTGSQIEFISPILGYLRDRIAETPDGFRHGGMEDAIDKYIKGYERFERAVKAEFHLLMCKCVPLDGIPLDAQWGAYFQIAKAINATAGKIDGFSSGYDGFCALLTAAGITLTKERLGGVPVFRDADPWNAYGLLKNRPNPADNIIKQGGKDQSQTTPEQEKIVIIDSNNVHLALKKLTNQEQIAFIDKDCEEFKHSESRDYVEQSIKDAPPDYDNGVMWTGEAFRIREVAVRLLESAKPARRGGTYDAKDWD